MNSRLLSILNVLGIPERFVNINKTDGFVFENIDYHEVDNKLSDYIMDSENWLKRVLE